MNFYILRNKQGIKLSYFIDDFGNVVSVNTKTIRFYNVIIEVQNVQL